MKMKNGKVKLQLPDCKSGCVPSGITNATQRGEKYKNIINAAFDGYEFIRKTSSYEIDEEKEKIFQIIMAEKKLSDKTIEDYKDQIKEGFTKKKESPGSSYAEMDIEKLDWNLVFIKKIIEDAFK